MRAGDAEAVRADEPHAGGAAERGEALAALPSGGVLEAGGEDQQRLHALGGAIARHPLHGRGGHGDHRQLDGTRHVAHGLPAADEVQRTVEARAEVRDHGGADRAGARARADDRDRRRGDEVLDRRDRPDALALPEPAEGVRADRGAELDLELAGARMDGDGEAAVRNTSIIAWFSGMTIAVSVSMPSAAARWATAPSSTVPTPRPCQDSATSNATSALPGRSRTYSA